MSAYLTKSKFVATRDCLTKLYYGQNRYPSQKEESDFLEQFAVGGRKIGKLAQLRFPEGILVRETDSHQAAEQTRQLLASDVITVFESAFADDAFLARVDILQKEGNRLKLIEVKSSSASDLSDILKDDGMPRAGKWEKHIADVTFQRMILSRCLPDFEIECYLMLLDKNKRSRRDHLPQWLIENAADGRISIRDGGEEILRDENLLTLFPVDEAVTKLLPTIEEEAAAMAPLVRAGFSKAEPTIGYKCKKCEYRIKNEGSERKNGFVECWGELAGTEPHLLNLYRLGGIKNPDGSRVADTLPQEGKASIDDVDPDLLKGEYAKRQRLQIAGREWVSEELGPVMGAVAYPLFFIDFEASRPVIPYSAGRIPYEITAFQWSCHTMENRSSEPEHSEDLREERQFPNYNFANSLRERLGDTGTVLIWSSFEKTVLREISEQIRADDDGPADLADWLDTFVEDSGRILDMEHLCKDHYFHPDMGGSTSIKAVLPAVWNNSPELRRKPVFDDYNREEDGEILSPYATLPRVKIGGETVKVADGGMAIKAYDRMLYGSDTKKERSAWAELLREYCKLDTLAMVMIWDYWAELTR